MSVREQRARLAQIERVEPFGETAVHPFEAVAGLRSTGRVLQQLHEADGGPQLEAERFLRARDVNRRENVRFRLRLRVSVAGKEGFAGEAMQLRVVIPLAGFLARG